MKILSSLALLMAAGWLSGCADHQVVNVPLNATQDNAGHIALASLV
ncbi:YgdI/YgdR family lipoprotein [Pseudomonas alkylphenolica]|nr:YgdI/YgdR family lipoprotein [Pseudomonas alkylphenolica]